MYDLFVRNWDREAYEGTNLSSILTNREMSSVSALPSKVGRAIRSTERLKRRMLRSGLKSRRSPLGDL